MSGETITVGNVSVMALQDIATPARPSIMFPMSTPEAMEPFQHWVNERGHFTINIGAFAVRSGGKLILVDTGIGNKNRAAYRNGALPENMRAAGIAPNDVDIVLITHLHIDHVGWNTVERDAKFVPFFPKARYVVQRREWEYWTRPEIADKTDYIQDSVLPLQDTGQIDLIEEITAVTPELTTVPTPGHTPGHVSIAIVSGAERAIITGDIAHHPVQLTEWEWSVAFDVDPVMAKNTRRQFIDRVERERELIIGTHFPAPGFGRLVRLGDRRVYEAVQPATA
jgi:glyoxylase-like metal-dependent hydrolase (beta-lactamase superfamily II)